MSKTLQAHERILAVYPNSRGFGFVVAEGFDRLIDWGVVQTKHAKHEQGIARVDALIERYEPDTVVTEDPERRPRRSARVRELLKAIRSRRRLTRTRWKGYSREQVRRTFHTSRSITKHLIAEGIAGRFPELASRLPPRRRPWMSEDTRMSIFEAVALYLTHCFLRKPPDAGLGGQSLRACSPQS